MNAIGFIVIGAIFVERLVAIVKMIKDKSSIQWQVVISMVIGIAISLLYKLDLPAAVGLVSSIPFDGEIITGLVISGGSNFLYDLIQKITTDRKRSGKNG